MSYEAIEKVDLCKYAKVKSLENHIECEYERLFFPSCPMDSGTDGKRNNKCAEVHFKEIKDNQN